MNDETSSSDKNQQDDSPLAGQRLAAARKSRDISIFDIAKELHLDEYKVQALEENKFDVLGAPVFAKGHLRKYADLVGVPIEDILADYYALNRAVGAPPVVGLPRKRQRDINLGPWLVGVVVFLAVAAVAFWWLGRTPAPAADTRGITAPETRLELPRQADAPVVAGAAEPAAITASGSSSVATTENAAVPLPASDSEPPAGPAETVAAVVAPPPAASGSQVRLTMTFAGDCWTEVSDASGARLYFDLGQEGRTINVNGEPPLRVLFGNSENVTVAVDGRDYPISAAMRRGQTARLTINKP